MKYKIYNILLVLIAIGFLGMFVGECDPVTSNPDCANEPRESSHEIFMEGTYGTEYFNEGYSEGRQSVSVNLVSDFKPMINGLNITFQKAFINTCNTKHFKNAKQSFCDYPTGKEACVFDRADYEGDAHFTVQANVFQGTTLITSLTPKFVNSKNISKVTGIQALDFTLTGFTYGEPGDYEVTQLMHYQFDFLAPAEGEYRVEYKVTEAKSDNVGEYTETITIGESNGLQDTYILSAGAFVCDGLTFFLQPDNIKSPNTLVINGTNATLKFDLEFDFSGPLSSFESCFESSYDFEEQGTFSLSNTGLDNDFFDYQFEYKDEDGNMTRFKGKVDINSQTNLIEFNIVDDNNSRSVFLSYTKQ